MIASALGVGIAGRRQKSIEAMAPVDMAYKAALARQALATARKTEAIGQPFVGGLTESQFKMLTPRAKEYLLAKHGARALGDNNFMSREEWEATKPSEREKFLTGLSKNPALKSLEIELRNAGKTTINIGNKVETATKVKEATDKVSRQSSVRSPDFASKITEKLMKNKQDWYSFNEADSLSKKKGIPYEQAQKKIQRLKVLKEMDLQIRTAFSGQQVEIKADGWYVNGKLEVRNPYGK